MHHRTFVAALVLPLAALAGAPTPKAFCETWSKVAKATTDYREALAQTVGALSPDKRGTEFEQALVGAQMTSGGGHLQWFKRAAQKDGVEFSCPAFEFPAGEPAHRVVVTDKDGQIDTIAARDGVLFVLRTRREGSSILEIGKVPRLLAEGLPRPFPSSRLIALDNEVIVTLNDRVVVASRTGAPPRTLAAHIHNPPAIAVDGESVVFLDGRKLFRVPIAGGEVETLATLTTEPREAAIAIDRAGYLVKLDDREALRVPKKGPAVVSTTSVSGVTYVVGSDLIFGDGHSQRAFRLGFSTEERVRVGEWSGDWSHRGAVFGAEVFMESNGSNWPGKASIVRWTPGKAATSFAAPVGWVDAVAVDAKAVYWLDRWYGAVYSAPR